MVKSGGGSYTRGWKSKERIMEEGRNKLRLLGRCGRAMKILAEGC